MNAAHFHLIMVHFPVAGTFLALAVLGYAAYRKSEELTRGAFWFLVVVALLAIPTYISGDEAHEIVEKLPGVAHYLIHEHEEAAESAFIAIEAAGVAALAGLFFFGEKRPRPDWFLPVVILIALVAAGLVGVAANRGGKIRHPEIEMSGGGHAPPGTATHGQQEQDDDD